MTDPRRHFSGAKLILLAGPRMLVLRRDFTPGIPWPGYLDLPGGAREGDETPETCALRETEEELGLRLPKGRARLVHTLEKPRGRDWFYVMQGPELLRRQVRFGDEGLGWIALTPAEFVNRSDAVPHFRSIVARYLRAKKTGLSLEAGPVRLGGFARGKTGRIQGTSGPVLPAQRGEIRLRARPLREA